MWSKWRFFDFFSKTALTILFIFGQNVEEIVTKTFAKTPHVQKMSVLEIFIHKVAILAKNGKSGVQRSCYISRRVNATENLIRYSESTINLLSLSSRQIFAYLSSSGRKFDLKTANFYAFFEWFFGIFSATTWYILMKLGQKQDKMDTKQTQKTRGHHFKPFWRYLGSNMAKIGQNRPKFMDDPKNFRKKIFFVKVSKWSNSQS